MCIREITVADVPALFAVRIATDENRLTCEQLRALGITEESVAQRLRSSHRGWLCEGNGHVVGFALGDRSTGELRVIAVLPAYAGRGIGSTLLTKVEAWLQSEGCAELWLTTGADPSLRAYAFYRRHGWEDQGLRDGVRYMTKRVAIDQTRDPAPR